MARASWRRYVAVGGALRVLMGERAGAGEACVKRARRRQPRDQRVWHLQPGRLRTGDHDRPIGLQRDRQRVRDLPPPELPLTSWIRQAAGR